MKRNLRGNILIILLIMTIVLALGLISSCSSSITPFNKTKNVVGKILQIEPDVQSGFHWPYLLYIPENATETQEQLPLLVFPNNTGKSSDDYNFHLRKAINHVRDFSSDLYQKNARFMVLMPVFPRFKTKMGGWRYYTHALDRDSMLNQPEKQIAVKIKWKGPLMSDGSSMRYDLENMFMVQNNLIYRCLAADYDPTSSITGVSAFEVSFIFESGVNFQKPFNIIEFPRNGGFIFRETYLNKQQKIVNAKSFKDSSFEIVKISETDDMDYPTLWNKFGERHRIDDKKSIRRLDEQLIAMIVDAKKKVKNAINVESQKKSFMVGVSASGMFVDRFSYLHPELVSAAAIGFPGGLPMSPLKIKNESTLRYPIGLSDYKKIAGYPFNRDSFALVSRMIFMGDQDSNDSVVYPDSFDKEDKELIFSHYGRTPVERFHSVKQIFDEEQISNTEFILYPKVGHELTQKMKEDILNFFLKKLQQQKKTSL
jgi:hypothetical protein